MTAPDGQKEGGKTRLLAIMPSFPEGCFKIDHFDSFDDAKGFIERANAYDHLTRELAEAREALKRISGLDCDCRAEFGHHCDGRAVYIATEALKES